MNPVLTMEAANLFCGLTASSVSNHLVLTDVKLPSLDVEYLDHRPGGSMVALEIDVQCNKLQCTFNLLGVQPQVMELFWSWASTYNTFQILGVMRHQITGEPVQAMAIINGQIGKADPQNFRRGDVIHTNYAIRGIYHYQLLIAGNQIYLWDFPTNTFTVGDSNEHPYNSSPAGTLSSVRAWGG